LLLVVGDGQQLFAQCRLGDDEKPPRLRIIAAWRAAGCVQQARQLVALNGGIGIVMAGGTAFVQEFA